MCVEWLKEKKKKKPKSACLSGGPTPPSSSRAVNDGLPFRALSAELFTFDWMRLKRL